MKYTTILLATVLASLLATGCNSEPCDQNSTGTCVGDDVGRVLTLQFVRPDVLDVMIEWPVDGVRDESHDAMFLGAYESPAGGLRIWGGNGHNGSAAGTLHPEQTFDVSAVRSDLGVYTESFDLGLTANDGQKLVMSSAVLFEIELDETADAMVPTRARLIGVISPQMAASVTVSRLNMTLAEFLLDSGSAPDVDFDHDGTNESWVAEGTLVTTPATLN